MHASYNSEENKYSSYHLFVIITTDPLFSQVATFVSHCHRTARSDPTLKASLLQEVRAQSTSLKAMRMRLQDILDKDQAQGCGCYN